jgi:hypothetical protein
MSTPESKQAALAAMKSVAETHGSIVNLFEGADGVGDESVGAFMTMRNFFAGKLTYLHHTACVFACTHVYLWHLYNQTWHGLPCFLWSRQTSLLAMFVFLIDKFIGQTGRLYIVDSISNNRFNTLRKVRGGRSNVMFIADPSSGKSELFKLATREFVEISEALNAKLKIFSGRIKANESTQISRMVRTWLLCLMR